MKEVYFPNLNGIRFIAALMVIIHHIEEIKSYFHIPSLWGNPIIILIGKLGVVLFFVLSGFLITFLLLKEKEEIGDIEIRKFYIRRILRIWPLYYLIFVLDFFVLSNIDFFSIPDLSSELQIDFAVKSILYLCLLPNLAISFFAPPPYSSQSWSIGVEEQFYLFWPALLKWFKNPLQVFAGVIIFYFAVKTGFYFFRAGPDSLITTLSRFWGNFLVDCMAIGSVAAYILIRKQSALQILFNRYVQVAIYLLTSILIFRAVKFPFVHYEVYAVLFAILILNLAANQKSIVDLENRPLNYLGKISYGLYMFHPLAIVIVIKAGSGYVHTNWIIYGGSVLLTVVLAVVSFELFEKRILRLKVRYSNIVSGDNVKIEKKNFNDPSN